MEYPGKLDVVSAIKKHAPQWHHCIAYDTFPLATHLQQKHATTTWLMHLTTHRHLRLSLE